MADDDQTVTISFRAPKDLARRLDKVTAPALSPSKSQICVEGMRLVVIELEKKMAEKKT